MVLSHRIVESIADWGIRRYKISGIREARLEGPVRRIAAWSQPCPLATTFTSPIRTTNQSVPTTQPISRSFARSAPPYSGGHIKIVAEHTPGDSVRFRLASAYTVPLPSMRRDGGKFCRKSHVSRYLWQGTPFATSLQTRCRKRATLANRMLRFDHVALDMRKSTNAVSLITCDSGEGRERDQARTLLKQSPHDGK